MILDPTDPTSNVSKDNTCWQLLKRKAQTWLYSLRPNESPGLSWNVLVRGLSNIARVLLQAGPSRYSDCSLIQDHRELVSQRCHDKAPCTGGLKQQKFTLSQFWGLEIQDQDVGRAMLPLKALGKSPSSPLPASGGH